MSNVINVTRDTEGRRRVTVTLSFSVDADTTDAVIAEIATNAYVQVEDAVVRHDDGSEARVSTHASQVNWTVS